MPKKLTNDIVDQRLIGRNIKRLGNYSNISTKIEFQCLINSCQNVWKAIPQNIINNKHGCPKCVGKSPLNNIIVDQKLIGRNLKRIGDYINCYSKIEFQCLVNSCQYIWQATTATIINRNSGCPKCANVLPLNNDILDQRLIGREIERIGYYINCSTKIEFQCLVCHNLWKATPNSILNNVGCPKCGGSSPLNNDLIDQKLFDRNIKRVGNYINNKISIDFQCLMEGCHYIWKTSPGAILRDTGCPSCAGLLPLTNNIIDQRLIGRNIKRLGNSINSSTKIEFQCLIEDCKNIWKAKPGNIVSGNNTGCPICNKIGKNEKLVLNVLVRNNIQFEQQKAIREIIPSENNRFRVDFYISSKNIIIEYNGVQHYQPVRFGGIEQDIAEINFIKQQARDKYVEQFCINNDIKLFTIDGRKYKNKKIENYMNTYLILQINGLK
jgi:hypothetical protein